MSSINPKILISQRANAFTVYATYHPYQPWWHHWWACRDFLRPVVEVYTAAEYARCTVKAGWWKEWVKSRTVL